MNDSGWAYNRILKIFSARLEMKHQLKGTSFRKKGLEELWKIMTDEISELDREIQNNRPDHAIEEACDVMISALMIADTIIHGGD